MTVLEVLPKMVCSVKLLGLIAFAEFMLVSQMCHPRLPVLWFVGKFFTTISANISRCSGIRMRSSIWIIGGWWYCSGGVEDDLELICDRRTGPGVATEM